MTTSDSTPRSPQPPLEEVWERLGVIAQLLDRAAVALWADADAVAADVVGPLAADLSDLATGFFLAHAQVAHMLPDGYRIQSTEPTETTVMRLATAAEELTLDLPATDPRIHGHLGGPIHLVAAVCDLIRQARRLGY